jgi:hypothetical protein
LRNSSPQQLRPTAILLPLWCALVAPAFSASIATYKDAAGRQHVYYFAVGNSSGGPLVVNYSADDSNWNPADFAVPAGEVAIGSSPSAITLLDNIRSNKQLVYAFVTGASMGHCTTFLEMKVHSQPGPAVDLGLPNGVTSVGYPAAVTYVDARGKWCIYVFVAGSDGTSGSALMSTVRAGSGVTSASRRDFLRSHSLCYHSL